MILAMHLYSFGNILSGVMAVVPRQARSLSALFLTIYIFLMLWRIFREKWWRTALKTVVMFLAFSVIEIASAAVIVIGVTWASGFWHR